MESVRRPLLAKLGSARLTLPCLEATPPQLQTHSGPPRKKRLAWKAMLAWLTQARTPVLRVALASQFRVNVTTHEAVSFEATWRRAV